MHRPAAREKAQGLDFIYTGGKLMMYWSVVLFLVEVVTFFGASNPTAKTMDGCAFAVTCLLFGLSTVGVRWIAKAMQRSRRETWGVSTADNRKAAAGR